MAVGVSLKILHYELKSTVTTSGGIEVVRVHRGYVLSLVGRYVCPNNAEAGGEDVIRGTFVMPSTPSALPGCLLETIRRRRCNNSRSMHLFPSYTHPVHINVALTCTTRDESSPGSDLRHLA